MIMVNDIYPSVQGEGAKVGTPMVILRLQGCDVGCVWCDTKETWPSEANKPYLEDVLGKNGNAALVDEREIAEHIRIYHPQYRWVMVTGGEPALQDLEKLVQVLHRDGLSVALETSGTARGSLRAAFDWVCVSPKIRAAKPIDLDVIGTADEIKTVIGKESDLALLEKLLVGWPVREDCIISLQPVSISKNATRLCLDYAMKRGWNISIQVHKYIEVA
jgi:7-carboxy-7-deazaguanine synthase